MVRRILLSLLAAAIVLIVDAVPAAADFWTEHCKVYGTHCYKLFKWGPPENSSQERFAGAAASFNVHQANTIGVRMQDEMWVSWEEVWPIKWGWVETGLTIGMQDCCTPYRFYAVKGYNESAQRGYYEADDWDHPMPYDVNNNFTIQHEVGNVWTVWWTNTPGGYDWTPVKSFSGFPGYFQDVELGLEAATFEAPINSATSTLGLIDPLPSYHYVQATGPTFDCTSPGNLGLWSDWEHGNYGSLGHQQAGMSALAQGATTPPVFSESARPSSPSSPSSPPTTTTVVRRKTKAWTGTVTSKEQTSSTTTVYHGKLKLAAPVLKTEPAPSGDTMIEVRDAAGRVSFRYLGYGEPNPAYLP